MWRLRHASGKKHTKEKAVLRAKDSEKGREKNSAFPIPYPPLSLNVLVCLLLF